MTNPIFWTNRYDVGSDSWRNAGFYIEAIGSSCKAMSYIRQRLDNSPAVGSKKTPNSSCNASGDMKL
jgi:hypothetical protein